MSTPNPPSTILSFLALYFTTLFSLDSWAAARASPFRAPSTHNSVTRPITPAAPSAYQAGMHGRGNAGPASRGGSARGGRDVGRVAQGRDGGPAMRMGGSAGCGACMI
ncbi:hypothetical protein ACET3X_005603 [Alternaria dauci]|uniref:Uncharacterized protein n=1 Tax=Alternaria dauci TaxID=48095 RepID=A0ABR3UKR0_9PLEO